MVQRGTMESPGTDQLQMDNWYMIKCHHKPVGLRMEYLVDRVRKLALHRQKNKTQTVFHVLYTKKSMSNLIKDLAVKGRLGKLVGENIGQYFTDFESEKIF